jgi:hypothetical protein
MGESHDLNNCILGKVQLIGRKPELFRAKEYKFRRGFTKLAFRKGPTSRITEVVPYGRGAGNI